MCAWMHNNRFPLPNPQHNEQSHHGLRFMDDDLSRPTKFALTYWLKVSFSYCDLLQVTRSTSKQKKNKREYKSIRYNENDNNSNNKQFIITTDTQCGYHNAERFHSSIITAWDSTRPMY
jgi:hypothetical protein